MSSSWMMLGTRTAHFSLQAERARHGTSGSTGFLTSLHLARRESVAMGSRLAPNAAPIGRADPAIAGHIHVLPLDCRHIATSESFRRLDRYLHLQRASQRILSEQTSPRVCVNKTRDRRLCLQCMWLRQPLLSP